MGSISSIMAMGSGFAETVSVPGGLSPDGAAGVAAGGGDVLAGGGIVIGVLAGAGVGVAAG
jgi:hypothetical protein